MKIKRKLNNRGRRKCTWNNINNKKENINYRMWIDKKR